MAVLPWIRRRYLELDPRTLGVFRLALGLLLSANLIRHWSVARRFYSNDGVLSNHWHLFRPSSGHNFSLFHGFSSIGEVHVAFAVALACHLCLLIGYRTRLFAVASFLIVTSLDNRLILVENGGYIVVNLITCYAMFMPLGRRFSVDALRRSYRARRETTVEDLNVRVRDEALTAPYVSLVSLLVIVNLAVIYIFNVVNKSGTLWRSGESVHYVLYLNRMVTGLAVFSREHLPYLATVVLTYGTLVMEALLPPLILSPTGRRTTRLLAMAIMTALHGTFGVMMRLGPFSWFLIGWSTLLLTREHWELFTAWHKRRSRPVTVLLSPTSPLAMVVARALVRLDPLAMLRFESHQLGGGRLIAARIAEGGPLVGVAAFDAIAQALPLGGIALRLVHVVSLGQVGRLIALVERRDERITRFFALGEPRWARPHRGTSTLALWAAAARLQLRELLLCYLAICAVSQAINENKSVLATIPVRIGSHSFDIPIKHEQPAFMQATLGVFRLYQGWGMFAPNPIQEDGVLAIDARTIDGRAIDPFRGAPPDLDLTDSRGEGLSQIQQDYENRIRLDRNKGYLRELERYLLHWHEETGDPRDQLVSFDVYWVKAKCPPPGESRMRDNAIIAILSYRKPGYSPPSGQPPLPPKPALASADK